MKTVMVWVLVLHIGEFRGSTVVVSDLATKADCERVASRVEKSVGWAANVYSTCTQVRKVVTQ